MNDPETLTLADFVDACAAAGVFKIKISPERRCLRVELKGRRDGKIYVSSAQAGAPRYMASAALRALRAFPTLPAPPADVPAPAPTPIPYMVPSVADAVANADAIEFARRCTCDDPFGMPEPHGCTLHGGRVS